MVRAIEVLNAIRVFLAQLFTQVFFFLFVEIKAALGEDRVFLDDFVEDVNV